MEANRNIKVLVTGASGYLATHCVEQLLEAGYSVRGTVRSLQNEKKINPLRALCPAANDRLELVEADLLKPETWPKALEDCKYVLHLASPFPIVASPKVIDIAVNGTLNVLKAAKDTPSVAKVVLTSSVASVNEGHGDLERVFDENDWTNVDSPTVTNYPKSKTLSEKAAWHFVNGITEGNKFKLTCINPTLIVGPLLMDEQGASVTIIRRFLNSEMPAVPRLSLALVDVRDVARAHVAVMTNSETDGERILVTAQPSFWFKDIASALAKEFSSQGYGIPRFVVPYPVVWIYSFFDSQTRAILERIGHEVRLNNSKAKKLLGMEFTDPSKSLVDMAYSMIERGIVPKKSGYRPRTDS